MKESLLPIQLEQRKSISGGVWPPYQGFSGMCPASTSQQMFLLLLSLLTNSEKSREGLDLQETSRLSNFQHKLFQGRMSQAYALPRLWLARDGLQPPWYAPDFTPALVRQHKILSVCLREFLL